MNTVGVSNQKPVYSIVAPVYNEGEGIAKFHDRVSKVMEGLGQPWELVLVNDGSKDNSLDEMRKLHQSDPHVKLVDFARNFGHQVAVTAGMDYAVGDAVVIIDSDLQDPPETIVDLIAKWKEGYEVVYAVRRTRPDETWFKLTTAKLFYRLLYRITEVHIPVDTGDFRLLDRRVVRAMVNMREHNRFIRGMTSWVGFRQTGVMYDRHAREWGKTNYPLRKMLKLAWDGVTGFSYFPLQLAIYISFALFLVALLAIPVIAIMRLATGQLWFEGQATAIILILLIGSFQFLFFFVMGQYLARIYDEVRGRPIYIVADTFGIDNGDYGMQLTGGDRSPEDDRPPEASRTTRHRAEIAPTSDAPPKM